MIKTSSGLTRKSSAIFRNLWKSLEILGKCSGMFIWLSEQSLENLWKSLESGRKSSLRLYSNSLAYHRIIFGSSLKVFSNLQKSSNIFGNNGNSRKMVGNVRLAFGTILENFRKSSESGWKSSENHQKRRHQYVYIIKRTLHVSSKIICYLPAGRSV